MLIGSRKRLSQIDSEPILSIVSKSVKRVSSCKTLAVVVDECITWKDHIDKLAKKASKGVGILRRAKELLDTNSLKNIYGAIVLPDFDHCAMVWNIGSKTLQNKLNCNLERGNIYILS